MENNERDLKVREAAAELRVGVHTVYALVKSGHLAAYNTGRNGMRIPPAAIAEFKASGGVSAEAGR